MLIEVFYRCNLFPRSQLVTHMHSRRLVKIGPAEGYLRSPLRYSYSASVRLKWSASTVEQMYHSLLRKPTACLLEATVMLWSWFLRSSKFNPSGLEQALTKCSTWFWATVRPFAGMKLFPTKVLCFTHFWIADEGAVEFFSEPQNLKSRAWPNWILIWRLWGRTGLQAH